MRLAPKGFTPSFIFRYVSEVQEGKPICQRSIPRITRTNVYCRSLVSCLFNTLQLSPFKPRKALRTPAERSILPHPRCGSAAYNSGELRDLKILAASCSR